MFVAKIRTRIYFRFDNLSGFTWLFSGISYVRNRSIIIPDYMGSLPKATLCLLPFAAKV